jgi:K+-transporting ATPase A subunit
MSASRFSGLTPLIAPRSVAVLGASSDPTRISGRPIGSFHRDLLRALTRVLIPASL